MIDPDDDFVADEAIGDMMEAAQRGDLDAVRDALESGIPVDAEDENGYQALSHAAMNNQADMARFLIDRGADVNATGMGYQTALFWATQEGAHDTAIVLLDASAEVDAPDSNGRTPLMNSCSCKDVRTGKLLIARGADVNARDHDQWVPLMMAAVEWSGDGYSSELMGALLAAGAVLDAQSALGQTVLHIAAMTGSTDAVRDLLQAGADATLVDIAGCTAEEMTSGETRSLLAAHRERPLLREAAGLTDDQEPMQRHRTM